MGGKTDVFENDILKLIFNGTAIANIADNAAASPLTALYLSLHTADPLDTATTGQSTNECNYTGYARIPINRNSDGWVVTGNSVSPVSTVVFGECTAGTQTATHAAIGTAASGTGKMLFVGAITPAIVISAGVVPRILNTSTLTED